MGILTTPRIQYRRICSALLVSIAFVALIMPVAAPSLNPALVGVHAFHGHVSVNGPVQPHSHDITSDAEDGLVFTSDDSAASGGTLVILYPALEGPVSAGVLSALHSSHGPGTDQWSPRTTPQPPELSA